MIGGQRAFYAGVCARGPHAAEVADVLGVLAKVRDRVAEPPNENELAWWLAHRGD